MKISKNYIDNYFKVIVYTKNNNFRTVNFGKQIVYDKSKLKMTWENFEEYFYIMFMKN